MKLKKALSCIFCVIMLFCMTSCSANNVNTPTNDNNNSAQLPNPIVHYESIEELRKAVDFDFVVPADLPEGYHLVDMSLIAGTVVQFIYQGDDKELTYRCVKVDPQTDISGDYTPYSSIDQVSIENATVTIRGDDDTVSLATWEDGELNYSLHSDPPIARDLIKSYLESI